MKSNKLRNQTIYLNHRQFYYEKKNKKLIKMNHLNLKILSTTIAAYHL